MSQKSFIPWRIGAYSLILVSFWLRIYQLDHIAIEKSEMTNIVWFIRKGLVTLLTQNKALNNHPLNSVLGYLTSSLGHESLFTLRWHSVVLGVMTVAVLYRLARIWFGERDALVAGLLVAFSAYAVNISQIARGYIGLVCLTSLGFYLAWRALETGQKRFWFAFVLASSLNIYSHLYGAMAVGAIGLIMAVLLLNRESARWAWSRLISTLASLMVSLVAVYVISLGLYLPMLADTLAVAGQSNQFSESDERHAEAQTLFETISGPVKEAIRPFNLANDELRLRLGDPTLHYSALDGLAALAQNEVGFYAGLATFLLGVIFSWSKFRRPTLICLAWLFLPFGLQWVANAILPGAYFRGRFLTFIFPPYLLLMARGWPGLADWLAAQAKGRAGLALAARGIAWLGVGLLLWLNLTWLGAYYGATANENWVELSRHLAQNVQANDIVYCGQRSDTACSFDLSVRLRREVKELDEDFFTFEEFQKNRAHFEQPGRVWVVLPHLLPWQIVALPEKIEPTHYRLLGDSRYDQAGWVVMDAQPTLVGNLAAALQLMADLSLNDEERYKNHVNLTKIYLGREQLVEAETAFAVAAKPLPGEASAWQQQQLAPLLERLEYIREAARLDAQLPPTAVRSNLNFGGLARLLAYQLDRQMVAPGESVQVSLYWQPLARIERDLVSYVYLTDLGAHLLGEAKGIPGAGQAPTTAWQPGQLVVDTYTVALADTVQAPLAAKVEAGLFDPNQSEFIKATDKTGQAAGPMLTKLKILPPNPPSAPAPHELKANFGDLISLTGYDLSTDPLKVVFYWQAQADLNKDYTVFLHLLDRNDQLVGQVDGQPFAGNYPTSWWSPGEQVVDQRLLVDLKPGDYRVEIGWYDTVDGSRLPLVDGTGDSLKVGAITVP